MKEITLRVPDHKIDFVMELIEQLGLEVSEEPEIPEEHKEIVRERIKTANPDDMIPWKEARKQFTFKSKSRRCPLASLLIPGPPGTYRK